MSAPERLAFGDFVLQRSQERVLRADGSELALTPRLFKALLLFVDHPDTLLDKDRLMNALWPGLVVEENNLSQTISSLRRALGDEPAGSRYIQTVARRGFRFVAPVTALPPVDAVPLPTAAPALLPEGFRRDIAAHDIAAHDTAPPGIAQPAVAQPDIAQPDIASPTHARRRLTLGLAAAAAALAAGAMAWLRGAAPTAPATPATPATMPPISQVPLAPGTARATVAVLPFKPLALESRDELLEVGMADSLITRLSLVPGLVLRSVASVRRYAGGEQDPLRAARELDVDWIVDGALQRRGDQLRVSARLLRASDGSAA